MCIGRHLVHESIYDDYVHRLADKASKLTVGNPAIDDVDLGPIIDTNQRDKIHELVTSSVSAGATLLTGGTFQGLFYRPTVLANAGPGIPAYDVESFGPVAAVTSFADIDEAARLAADTEFGLVLGILAADIAVGFELAERIPTAVVHINDQTFGDDPQVPFGGMGQSGNPSRFGRTAVSVDAYTEQRWITAHAQIPAY